jgi:hypothetical protein
VSAKDLISVFEAINMAEAEMINAALKGAGIEAFIEKTPSPLDGLTAIGEGTEVMVREEDEEKALQVIEDYLAEMDMAEDGELDEEFGDDDDLLDDDEEEAEDDK